MDFDFSLNSAFLAEHTDINFFTFQFTLTQRFAGIQPSYIHNDKEVDIVIKVNFDRVGMC